MAPPYYSIGGAYPPYGWILAANITGAQLTAPQGSALYGISSDAISVNFCGGNSNPTSSSSQPVCTFNPVNLNPANYQKGSATNAFDQSGKNSYGILLNYYNGTYYPIGPQLRAMAMNSGQAAQMSDDVKIGWTPEYNKIGFSVNFNDSIDILFPNSTPKNPLYDIGGDPITNPNIYKELIFTRLNVENYTKLFGGLPPYNCLTDASFYANTVCGYLPGVKYMNPPVYTATDAFKFLESLGSPSVMPIEGIVYSTTSGNGFNSNALCSNAIAAIENGVACGSLVPNTIVPNSIQTTSGMVAQMPLLFGIPESLSSKISGYSLIPYTYNVLISNEDNTVSNSYQVFTYQTVGSSSNNFDSTIEGLSLIHI